jgi:rod shape-determining protein MreC
MKPRRNRWNRPRPIRSPRSNRHTPRSAAPLALLLIAAGIGIGYVHKRFTARKKTDPVLSAVGAATYPFQKGVALAQAGVAGGVGGLFAGSSLQKENAALQKRLSDLEMQNARLKDAAAQVERLKQEVSYIGRQKRPPLVSEVIGWLPSPIKQTITIASRARDGVSEGSVVVTSKGLVGRVVESELLRAQVRLLVDPDSWVPAMALRQDKIVGMGIVRGGGKDNLLRFEFLKPEDTLQHNDRVVTSGQGGVFPQGITVGWVEKVTRDAAHFSKTATVKPATPQPGDLREVLVLR